MPTLDDLRTESEAKLEKVLAKLDARHRATLRTAVDQYGWNVPDSVWQGIQKDQENEEVAAAILLLLLAGDEWTTAEIKSQGVVAKGYAKREYTSYGFEAQRRTQQMAAQSTATLRSRVARKLQDAALSTATGDVGELTPEGIDDALDDVFTQSRRETLATDQTTSGFSLGQRRAAERAEAAAGKAKASDGGDGAGAGTDKKFPYTIALIWRTEKDNLVCARCSPLEGQPEEVWGRVFPNGPGPACHPNCRCSLDIRAVLATE